jgi:hypothetical protein
MILSDFIILVAINGTIISDGMARDYWVWVRSAELRFEFSQSIILMPLRGGENWSQKESSLLKSDVYGPISFTADSEEPLNFGLFARITLPLGVPGTPYRVPG